MLHKRHKHDILVLLAVFGVAVSVYLTVYKSLGVAIPCTITQGCEAVLSSKYANLIGVPLSVWGIVFFSGIIIAALLANHYAVWRKLLTAGLAIGSLASLVFLGLQFFVIKQVCQYCLVTDVLTILLLVIDINIEHSRD